MSTYVYQAGLLQNGLHVAFVHGHRLGSITFVSSYKRTQDVVHGVGYNSDS